MIYFFYIKNNIESILNFVIITSFLEILIKIDIIKIIKYFIAYKVFTNFFYTTKIGNLT